MREAKREIDDDERFVWNNLIMEYGVESGTEYKQEKIPIMRVRERTVKLKRLVMDIMT